MRLAEWDGSGNRDIYLDERTGILENKARARTQPGLDQTRADFVGARALELLGKPAPRPGSPGYSVRRRLRAIHRQLFQDVFSWAGEFREIEMVVPLGVDPARVGPTADGARYLEASEIGAYLDGIDGHLQGSNWFRVDRPRGIPDFVRFLPMDEQLRIARLAGETLARLFYTRPFRAGNTEVFRCFFDELGRDGGIGGFNWAAVGAAKHDLNRIAAMRPQVAAPGEFLMPHDGLLPGELALMRADCARMLRGPVGWARDPVRSAHARMQEFGRLSIGREPPAQWPRGGTVGRGSAGRSGAGR